MELEISSQLPSVKLITPMQKQSQRCILKQALSPLVSAVTLHAPAPRSP
jgi:hypothetical protein